MRVHGGTVALSLMLVGTNLYWWNTNGAMLSVIQQQSLEAAVLNAKIVQMARGQSELMDRFISDAKTARDRLDWPNWAVRASAVTTYIRDHPEDVAIADRFCELFEEAAHADDPVPANDP